MRTYASIRNRSAWLIGRTRRGRTNSPWGISPTPSPWKSAERMPFGFDITDDGAGGYHLVYYSMDGVYCNDTWHETLSDAYATAEESFGIGREEWGPPQDD